jgi:hypothetical protein
MSGRPIVRVNSKATERAGCDLLQKAFGGTVREFVSEKGTPMVTWHLDMDAAKFRSIFEKFGIAKHMTLKTDEAYFLLGCAKMGHFRDGERIQQALRSLRTGPHRLSGPGAGVPRLLATIRDVPSFRGHQCIERKRQWEAEQVVVPEPAQPTMKAR